MLTHTQPGPGIPSSPGANEDTIPTVVYHSLEGHEECFWPKKFASPLKKKEPNAPLGVSSCIYSLETQTHSEVALQNQPDNIIYAPFPWLLRWRDPILPNSHTKNTYTFWLPVGHTVAEGFGNHTSSFLHSFNLLVAKSCIHVCLCVSGLVNRSNWSYVTRPRTSKARSLRPLKIENSAGNVQPLFSVKKRKNDLNNQSNSQEVKYLKARAE